MAGKEDFIQSCVSDNTIDGIDRVAKVITQKKPRFFVYNPAADDSFEIGESDDDGSEASDCVTEVWSEFENENGAQHISREAQEAVVQEQFKEAIDALQNMNQQKSLRIMTGILLSLPMQEFHVENWRDFDWTAATSKSSRILSNMAKTYFSINVAVGCMVENPVSFYMQALSIYPKLTDIWYVCGNAAAKNHEWLIAEFCFKKCDKEFRALESLLLLYFVTENFHKCVQYVEEVLSRCEDHCLANVIKMEIIMRNDFWKGTFEKCSNRTACSKIMDLNVRKKILTKIETFAKEPHLSIKSKSDAFSELISQSRQFYSPFVMVFQRNARVEEIGTLLCDAFDRIEMFSSLSNQIVIVKEAFSTIDETGKIEAVIADAEEKLEYDFVDVSQLVEERAVLEDVINAVCYEITKEFEEEANQKRSHKKKAGTLRKSLGKNSRIETTEGLLSDDELTRRRSTRFVEDVEACLPTNEEEGTPKLETMWNYMSINIDSYEKMSPFSFSNILDEKDLLNSEMDLFEASPLSSMNPLVTEFLENSEELSKGIEYFLNRFLEYLSSSVMCQSCAFNVEQSKVFRQVYLRWCETFAIDLFRNLTLDQLNVHLVAAELGSPLALSILQAFYSFEENPKRLLTTSFEDESRVNEFFIRYRWLAFQLKPSEAGFVDDSPEYLLYRFTNLSNIAQIVGENDKIFSRLSLAQKRDGELQKVECISLGNIYKLLYKESKCLYAKQIDQLRDAEDYEELFDVLLNYYNSSKDDEEEHIEKIFLLIKCAVRTKRESIALSSILTVFQKIRGNVLPSKKCAKNYLRRCMEFLNEIEIFALDEAILCGFGVAVVELLTFSSDSNMLANCMELWILCYKIAKHREQIDSSLDEFYANGSENCLPTKSLMILLRAHEVLGHAQKCWKHQGKLLHLFLTEMHAALENSFIRQRILSTSDGGVSILKNVALETFQCLVCVFGEPLIKIRTHYDDHGTCPKIPWEMDWALAEFVLPLIMPHVLPDFSALEKISNYFSEVVLRIFKFVLDVEQEAVENLRKFLANPPRMELKEVLDEDGVTSHCAEEFVVEGSDDPRVFLYGKEYQKKAEEDMNKAKRWELSTKCLYALGIFHYRNNNCEEALRMIRSCLAICGPYLDNVLQSSAWFIFARCVTNNYSTMQDAEFLRNVDEFLLPFKMTIYLKKNSCDAHLDLATIMYQIRTRIKRFSKKDGAITEEQKRIYHAKIEGMIPKCRTHFELARRYNDSDAEVPWLSAYFLAKISEKLGDSPETVFKSYYESAIALENEGYQYPQKIHRTKQTNFEPLEIHYKVHAYAYKKLNVIQSQISHFSSRRDRNRRHYNFDLAQILSFLKCLYTNVRRFFFQAVEQKGYSKPEFYCEDSSVLLNTLDLGVLGSVKNSARNDGILQEVLDTDIMGLMCDLTDAVELMEEVRVLCVQGFETILSKFPHYKACYRIAESQYMQCKFRQCSDTLFHRLFFNAKKRLTASSNIFENIVEIVRADIERSGSFPYHIHKIIDLAIVSSFKCHDMDRLVTIMHSLLAFKNEYNNPDMLDEKSVDILRRKCTTGIIGISGALKTAQATAHACIQLSDLIRKMTRDNVSGTKLLEVAHQRLVQKRTAFEQKLNQQKFQQLQNCASKRRSEHQNLPNTTPKVPNNDVIIISPEKSSSGFPAQAHLQKPNHGISQANLQMLFNQLSALEKTNNINPNAESAVNNSAVETLKHYLRQQWKLANSTGNLRVSGTNSQSTMTANTSISAVAGVSFGSKQSPNIPSTSASYATNLVPVKRTINSGVMKRKHAPSLSHKSNMKAKQQSGLLGLPSAVNPTACGLPLSSSQQTIVNTNETQKHGMSTFGQSGTSSRIDFPSTNPPVVTLSPEKSKDARREAETSRVQDAFRHMVNSCSPLHSQSKASTSSFSAPVPNVSTTHSMPNVSSISNFSSTLSSTNYLKPAIKTSNTTDGCVIGVKRKNVQQSDKELTEQALTLGEALRLATYKHRTPTTTEQRSQDAIFSSLLSAAAKNSPTAAKQPRLTPVLEPTSTSPSTAAVPTSNASLSVANFFEQQLSKLSEAERLNIFNEWRKHNASDPIATSNLMTKMAESMRKLATENTQLPTTSVENLQQHKVSQQLNQQNQQSQHNNILPVKLQQKLPISNNSSSSPVFKQHPQKNLQYEKGGNPLDLSSSLKSAVGDVQGIHRHQSSTQIKTKHSHHSQLASPSNPNNKGKEGSNNYQKTSSTFTSNMKVPHLSNELINSRHDAQNRKINQQQSTAVSTNYLPSLNTSCIPQIPSASTSALSSTVSMFSSTITGYRQQTNHSTIYTNSSLKFSPTMTSAASQPSTLAAQNIASNFRQVENKVSSNFGSNTLTAQQQYLFNLYKASLRQEKAKFSALPSSSNAVSFARNSAVSSHQQTSLQCSAISAQSLQNSARNQVTQNNISREDDDILFVGESGGRKRQKLSAPTVEPNAGSGVEKAARPMQASFSHNNGSGAATTTITDVMKLKQQMDSWAALQRHWSQQQQNQQQKQRRAE